MLSITPSSGASLLEVGSPAQRQIAFSPPPTLRCLFWCGCLSADHPPLQKAPVAMPSPEIRIFDDGRELAAEAADLFIWLGQQALAADGAFSVALSGGSTPRLLYEELVQPSLAKQLDWTKVRLFFGDERCVRPDHADSNFRLAQDHLFAPLKIQAPQVTRMEGELDPETAASRYEAGLRERFGVGPQARPRFHLILLGLGDDGHTASLFPQTPALAEAQRLVTVGRAPTGVRDRITFTAPLINEAAAVLFLVVGSGKAHAVKAILEPGGGSSAPLPASLIMPRQGRLIWFLDKGAAGRLSSVARQLTSHEE